MSSWYLVSTSIEPMICSKGENGSGQAGLLTIYTPDPDYKRSNWTRQKRTSLSIFKTLTRTKRVWVNSGRFQDWSDRIIWVFGFFSISIFPYVNLGFLTWPTLLRKHFICSKMILDNSSLVIFLTYTNDTSHKFASFNSLANSKLRVNCKMGTRGLNKSQNGYLLFLFVSMLLVWAYIKTWCACKLILRSICTSFLLSFPYLYLSLSPPSPPIGLSRSLLSSSPLSLEIIMA